MGFRGVPGLDSRVSSVQGWIHTVPDRNGVFQSASGLGSRNSRLRTAVWGATPS